MCVDIIVRLKMRHLYLTKPSLVQLQKGYDQVALLVELWGCCLQEKMEFAALTLAHSTFPKI